MVDGRFHSRMLVDALMRDYALYRCTLVVLNLRNFKIFGKNPRGFKGDRKAFSCVLRGNVVEVFRDREKTKKVIERDTQIYACTNDNLSPPLDPVGEIAN